LKKTPQTGFYGRKSGIRVDYCFEQLFILALAQISAYPFVCLNGMCPPPLVAFPAQNFDVQHVEADLRPDTLREDMGNIKEVVGMNRILGSRLAAHNAPLMVSFHAGDFEESMEVVYLLLACTFLRNWVVASQLFFFGGLTGLEGRT
jgi:hypothetical protein